MPRDCFALVRAHQHGITIHNQELMRERERGYYHLSHSIMGGGGGGRGKEGGVVQLLLSILLGGEELCLEEGHSVCSSPLLHQT